MNSPTPPAGSRPVPTLGGAYYATPEGKIFSTFSGRVLADHLGNTGYLRVNVRVDGGQKTRPVHSLVAEAFLGPRPEGQTVNHIDHDKQNNRPENLEYLSPKANTQAYYRHKDGDWLPKGLRAVKNSGVVLLAVHPVTKHEIVFASPHDAVALGFDATGIANVLAGRGKTHKGYVFKEA